MQETGIITGATTHINYSIFGYKTVAYLLISVDPQQEGKLTEYLQKMPEIYSFYSRGAKGDFDVLVIIKSLDQLNDIKDKIKRTFSIIEMKTAIWTGVKEMNDNLSITTVDASSEKSEQLQADHPKVSDPKTATIDEVDQKIADKLAENGRASFQKLSREIGISPNAIKKRYERLRKNGALKVTIQSCPAKLGYRAICIFFAVTSHENAALIEKIGGIPDIISIMKTSGDYDMQIWVMVKDIDHLLSIQEQLRKMDGILKMYMEVARVLDVWPTPRQYISTF